MRWATCRREKRLSSANRRSRALRMKVPNVMYCVLHSTRFEESQGHSWRHANVRWRWISARSVVRQQGRRLPPTIRWAQHGAPRAYLEPLEEAGPSRDVADGGPQGLRIRLRESPASR